MPDQDVIRIYTVQDVALALKCTARCVYNYLRSGKIPGQKIGGRWRILEDDLREFISTGAIGGGSAPQGERGQ